MKKESEKDKTINKIIAEYIDNHIPWACLSVFQLNDVIIFKGQPKSLAEEVRREKYSIRIEFTDKVDGSVVGVKDKPIVFDEPELKPEPKPNWDDETIKQAANVIGNFGKNFPFISIGDTNGATTVTIEYKQTVILDYVDPDFFTKLDKVLDIIKTCDNLSTFSL